MLRIRCWKRVALQLNMICKIVHVSIQNGVFSVHNGFLCSHIEKLMHSNCNMIFQLLSGKYKDTKKTFATLPGKCISSEQRHSMYPDPAVHLSAKICCNGLFLLVALLWVKRINNWPDLLTRWPRDWHVRNVSAGPLLGQSRFWRVLYCPSWRSKQSRDGPGNMWLWSVARSTSCESVSLFPGQVASDKEHHYLWWGIYLGHHSLQLCSKGFNLCVIK